MANRIVRKTSYHELQWAKKLLEENGFNVTPPPTQKIAIKTVPIENVDLKKWAAVAGPVERDEFAILKDGSTVYLADSITLTLRGTDFRVARHQDGKLEFFRLKKDLKDTHIRREEELPAASLN